MHKDLCLSVCPKKIFHWELGIEELTYSELVLALINMLAIKNVSRLLNGSLYSSIMLRWAVRPEKWCGWCVFAAPKFTTIYSAANYLQNF